MEFLLLVVVVQRLFNGTDNFPMVAVPLFILAGGLMNHAGISKRLVDFAASLVGFVRGGLAMTTTLSSMFFSEVSGSAVADAAGFAAAVLSSSATIRDHRPALDSHDSVRRDHR